MPLITVTVQRPKSAAFKSAALAAVHKALVAAGVPEKDRFHRVLELDAEDFRFDPDYPDLTAARDENFVLIEIVLSAGRSVKIKRKIVSDIVGDLASGELKLNPETVMIVLKETTWENWSFGGGRLIHA
jgi:phenylpyruvate tautomerase PptA (4-oxalocrotonate tautomerase family)